MKLFKAKMRVKREILDKVVARLSDDVKQDRNSFRLINSLLLTHNYCSSSAAIQCCFESLKWRSNYPVTLLMVSDHRSLIMKGHDGS